MITLTLQCCPSDTAAAMDLAKLICEIEREPRENGEFFLIYRRDCDPRLPKFFEHLAGMRFKTVKACMARNHDEGWPAGSNMLAFSSIMEMSVLRRVGLMNNAAFLLFEPDCVPLTIDWIDQLSVEWDKTVAEGKDAFGHWNMPGSIPENLHMNGNCVLRADFHDRHPDILNGSGMQGWDFWYREKLIPISRDSYAIHQLYGIPTIALEDLQKLEKHGKRPALLHGVKDGSARAGIRRLLFANYGI